MSYCAVDKVLQVTANAIYILDENGVPEAEPVCNDGQVTLPAISFSTTDVTYMGTMTVADLTRVDDVAITLSMPTYADSLKVANAKGILIRFAMQIEKAETGESDYQGFAVYAFGRASGFGGGALTPGDASQGDITYHCTRYKFISQEMNDELINIDRRAGIIAINGVNTRSKLNRLLESRFHTFPLRSPEMCGTIARLPP